MPSIRAFACLRVLASALVLDFDLVCFESFFFEVVDFFLADFLALSLGAAWAAVFLLAGAAFFFEEVAFFAVFFVDFFVAVLLIFFLLLTFLLGDMCSLSLRDYVSLNAPGRFAFVIVAIPARHPYRLAGTAR